LELELVQIRLITQVSTSSAGEMKTALVAMYEMTPDEDAVNG
jgi:hypothetical protein